MLYKVSEKMMTELVETTHPQWDTTRIKEFSINLLKNLDKKLDNIIFEYCTTKKTGNFSYSHNNESFSILEIQAMRHNCSFLDAIILMDNYIKDPEEGRIKIMRR